MKLCKGKAISIRTRNVFLLRKETDERRIRNEISVIKQEFKLWDRTIQDTSQMNTTAIYSRSCESHIGY